jgi:hypothetical protein
MFLRPLLILKGQKEREKKRREKRLVNTSQMGERRQILEVSQYFSVV